MTIKLNTNYAPYQGVLMLTEQKSKSKSKTEQIDFQRVNGFTATPFISPNNYKASALSLSSLQKLNKVSFGAETEQEKTAKRVAEVLYKYRKPDNIKNCKENPCPKCCSMLKSKVLPFIEKNEPIDMLMICFPFKAPSGQKVLSPHPDKAEEVSLKYLKNIIDDVEQVYKPDGKPGAQMTIYSDNFVFSRFYSTDKEARLYQKELQEMSKKIGVNDHIKFKTMEDAEFFDEDSAPKDLKGRREWLFNKYGHKATEEELHRRMKLEPSDPEFMSPEFIRGIKKFNEEILKGIFVSTGNDVLKKQFEGNLIMRLDENNYVHFIDLKKETELDKEDKRVIQAIETVNQAGQKFLASKYGESNNPYVRISDKNDKLRVVATKSGGKLIKSLAYNIIQTDQCWVRYINDKTKDRVRLSVHPQPCGSFKTGIDLAPENAWITPWNACAVEIDNTGDIGKDYILTKSSIADNAGCKVVYDEETGNPSHYKLPDNPEKAEIAKKELAEKR